MYKPESPPRDFEDVERELQAIELAFIESTADFIQLKIWNAAPARPSEGMVVYADGANWNPGSGEGIYRYTSSGTWALLG